MYIITFKQQVRFELQGLIAIIKKSNATWCSCCDGFFPHVVAPCVSHKAFPDELFPFL